VRPDGASDMELRVFCDVFGEIYKASNVSSMPPHTPSDRILKKVAQQPKKVYNTSVISYVAPIKATDVLIQTVDNG
jgi:hypothetical protein